MTDIDQEAAARAAEQARQQQEEARRQSQAILDAEAARRSGNG